MNPPLSAPRLPPCSCSPALRRARAAPLDCDFAGAREKMRLARVNERLDMVLADGRMIYFPRVEPPRATPAAPDRPQKVAAELTSLLADKNSACAKARRGGSLGPDPGAAVRRRRGRIGGRNARLGRPCHGQRRSGGLRQTRAGGGSGGARANNLGFWADPDLRRYCSPDDGRNFAGRAGTLALVEGRVSQFRPHGAAAFISISRSGRGGFSLTIARRNLPLFERAGLGEKNLLHRSIRARGVVEIGAAPQIELFHPDQIEFIEDRN